MNSATPRGPLSVLDRDVSARTDADGSGRDDDGGAPAGRSVSRESAGRGRLGLGVVALTVLVLVFLTGFGTWSLRNNRATGRNEARGGVLRSARVASVLAGSLVGTALGELRLVAASPAFVSGDPAQMSAYLAHLNPALYGFTGGMAWIDRTGLGRVSSASPNGPFVSVADREYFKTALSGKVTVSQGLKSRSNGAFVLVFAAPTMSVDGKVSGVITGSVTLSQFNPALIRQLFGTSDLEVYDSASRLIIGPSGSTLGSRLPADIAGRSAHASSGLVSSSGATDRGRNVVAFAKVDSAKWTLVVAEPAAVLDAAVDHQYDRSLALLVALSFAALLGAALAASKLDSWHGRVADERARLAAVIDRLPAGVAVVNPDGRIAMANRPALDALGALGGEGATAEIGDNVPEQVVARLEPGKDRASDDLVVGAEGAERFFAIRSTPVGRRRGGVGAVALIEETTARQTEERRRVAAADLLAAISVSETADSIARVVVERSADAIGCRWAAVVEVAADGQLVVLATADDPAWNEVLDGEPDGGHPVVTRAVTEQRIVDLAADDRPDGGVGHAIVFPLQSAGRAVGALAIGYAEPDPALDLPALSGFAAQVGLALDRARRRKIEHDVSLTLQRTLLASAPVRRPDLSVAVRYLPATEEMLVGGDFYDVIELDDDAHLLLIGDVVGHGLEAATTMGQLKIAIRAFAQETRSPARILAKLDAFVTDQLGAARYSTAAMVVVDRVDGVLRAAVAGHPPPLVRTGDGGVSMLPVVQQPLLGMPPAAGRTELETPIAPGATGLCLYTDGLIERPEEMLDDGIARLADALSHADGWDVERTAEQVMSLVEAGPHRDDVALLYALIHG